MGRAISMSEAIAIEVDVDVEGDRHRRQALVTAVGKYLAAHDPDKASHPALLEREDCTLVAWYPCLNVKTARSWRGIVAYAPRAGGAYDSHHRTAGIAGRTRRCGGGVAARGERVIGHQGDMFWRAHLKLARQMAGERS